MSINRHLGQDSVAYYEGVCSKCHRIYPLRFASLSEMRHELKLVGWLGAEGKRRMVVCRECRDQKKKN